MRVSIAQFRLFTLALGTVAPLTLGGLIYIALRPTSLLMFDWFEYTGLSPLVTDFRLITHPLRSQLPNWAVYSFPQGAWVWFGTMTMQCIWQPLRSAAGHLWIAFSCLLAIGGEIAQGLKLVTGTFDLTDIVSSLLGYFAALSFFHCFRRHFTL